MPHGTFLRLHGREGSLGNKRQENVSSPFIDIAGQSDQQADGPHHIYAGGMHIHPVAVLDDGPFSGGIEPGQLPDALRRYRSYLLGPFRSQRLDVLPDFVET